MKVSVCMATYNGAKYLCEQVDSILRQEFRENGNVELELVVSDDGSSDDTLRILESYHDDRIRIFHHQRHRRQKYYDSAFACTANFAHAMEKATGDYIFLSDQDDVWYPWKIDKSLSLLKARNGGTCGVAFDLVDENLVKSGEVIYQPTPFFFLRNNHSLYGFTCGFAREELRYLLPFPDVPFHDTFIMLTAQWRKRMFYIDDICAAHRWSGTHNVSSIANTTPVYIRLGYRIQMWAIVIWRWLIMKVRRNTE